LAFERQQPLDRLLGTRLLGAEFEQGGAAEHLGGAGWVLLAGELQHQLVIAHRLQGGFGDAEPVDAPLQHILDRFKLVMLHTGDLSGGHHLQGELAAATEIKSQAQSVGSQQRGGGNCQSQDEGEPPLLTCHRT
jgi:hypothetical protein